jgi:hypothetical protein
VALVTRAVYLIGGPGVGKSTILRLVLRAGWDVGSVFKVTHRQTGFPCLCSAHPWGYKRWTQREMLGHTFTSDRYGLGAYMGHLRSEYPGTDALSRSVMPQVKLWLPSLELTGVSWVFGEGERLGNVGFLTALAECTDLQVYHLVVSTQIAEVRRSQRPGKVLPDKFVQSKTTGAANLAASLPPELVTTVDTDQPVADVVAKILS